MFRVNANTSDRTLRTCVLCLVLCLSATVAYAGPTANYALYPMPSQVYVYDPINGNAKRFVQSGRYAYIANLITQDSSEVDIVDLLATGNDPQLIATIPMVDTNPADLDGIAIAGPYTVAQSSYGPYLYVSFYGIRDDNPLVRCYYVESYDVSNPTSPVYVGRTRLYGTIRMSAEPLRDPGGLDHLIVQAPAGSDVNAGIRNYAVDPLTGELQQVYRRPYNYGLNEISLRETFGALASLGATSVLQGFDVSDYNVIYLNPTAPALLGAKGRLGIAPDRSQLWALTDGNMVESYGICENVIQTPRQLTWTSSTDDNGLDAEGPYLIIGKDNSSVDIYDASVPSNVVFLKNYGAELPANAKFMKAASDSVYISGDQFRIIDLHSLRTEQCAVVQSTLVGGTMGALAVYDRDGSQMVGYAATNKGLSVCWVGSDGILRPEGQDLYVENSVVHGLSISDDDRLVYCTGGDALLWSLASDPRHPDYQATVPLAHGSAERGVLLGGRLYLASGANWFSIYEVSSSGSATHLQSVETSGFASDVALRVAGTDTLAYVAVSSGGVAAYKVHVSRPPQLAATWSGATVKSLSLHGAELYAVCPATACGDGSVRILDVASSGQISELAMVSVHEPTGAAVSGENLFVGDGQVVKAYDVSTPTTPMRIGMLDCREKGFAFAVTNSVWVLTAGGVRYGALQSETSPTLLTNDPDFNWYLDLSTNSIVWEFTWYTKEWTDPLLEEVVLRDDNGATGDCVQFGSGTVVPGSLASVAVKPDLIGGYRHVLTWSGLCIPTCRFWYKARSRVNDEAGTAIATTEKSFKFNYCPQS